MCVEVFDFGNQNQVKYFLLLSECQGVLPRVFNETEGTSIVLHFLLPQYVFVIRNCWPFYFYKCLIFRDKCFFLFIEYIGVTLGNKIIQVSGVQFYNTSSVLRWSFTFLNMWVPDIILKKSKLLLIIKHYLFNLNLWAKSKK